MLGARLQLARVDARCGDNPERNDPERNDPERNDPERNDHDHELKELKEIVSWRRKNQPGGANAGSVFRNPDGTSAGALIDRAGLKGYAVGGAHVSAKHANFIQAEPDGLASDVVQLMLHIVDAVYADSGIRLHAETRLVGFGASIVEALTHDDSTVEAGGLTSSVETTEGTA